jgi:hypothetical protein
MDYLKSRRIVKKKLLIEAVDENIADIDYLHKTLMKGLVKVVPKRFLVCYGEQELQKYNTKRK